MTSTEREDSTTGLTRHLAALVESLDARSVATYLARDEEPETRPFLEWASEHGIRVLLPISRADGLLDWAAYDGGEEQIDDFGMPAPTGRLLSPMAIGEVELILVPAACVDRTGMRLGWGRGYFDKTLGSMQRRPPVYAVLFDSELVDSVPTEAHDQRVDGVVTPSGVIEL